MNMWTYVRNFADTEFGGKTGTSNNHSDAWFVGVNPKLVCGAWVGGEYRAIHFRTGALGQGSRTALPICGAFYEKVLSDPAFQHYHGKFAAPKNQDISASMYQCDSYNYTPSDTLYTDSLGGWDVEEQWEQDETDEPEQETDQESTTSPNTPESPTTPTPPNP